MKRCLACGRNTYDIDREVCENCTFTEGPDGGPDCNRAPRDHGPNCCGLYNATGARHHADCPNHVA
jgi:hypothetical protein